MVLTGTSVPAVQASAVLLGTLAGNGGKKSLLMFPVLLGMSRLITSSVLLLVVRTARKTSYLLRSQACLGMMLNCLFVV